MAIIFTWRWTGCGPVGKVSIVSQTALATNPETPRRALLDRVLAKVGDAPAWVLSVLVHLGLFFLFAGIVYRTAAEKPEIEIVSTMEEPDMDQYAFETATTLDEIGNNSNLNTLSPSQASATQMADNPQQLMERRIDQEFNLETMPNREMMVAASELDLTSAFEVTGTTEHTGGVEGAIDRLTNEIAASLREKETTVIWLFDASLSLRERRDMIADRFDTIYGQLDSLGVLAGERLLTVAATYSNKTTLLTEEPTADVAKIAQAIRDIPDPDSGDEYVMTAVHQVTAKFMTQRTRLRRNVMVVIVTDERGDDFQSLDAEITRLKRAGIKVYCVGNAAPLGQVEEMVPWTYEDGFVQQLPVDRGPESAVPQVLALPFWGKGPAETHSSGYGPYGLTRLAAETGGLFLVSEETAKSFDPAIMRNYAPDYRPLAKVEQEIMKSPAKRVLVEAARMTESDSFRRAIPMPADVFPGQTDTVLRQAITEAQKPMAVVDHNLQMLSTILEQGIKDREKLKEPRWRASFDLAVGRTAALRARAFGYNTVLAEMKLSPKTFENKNSNQWALKPSQEIAGGPAVKSLAKVAREYLSRVIDEHPGTPWASLAARELSTPMGWQWVEQNDLVERFGPRANDPEVARLLLAEEEERMRERMKNAPEKRNPPKL